MKLSEKLNEPWVLEHDRLVDNDDSTMLSLAYSETTVLQDNAMRAAPEMVALLEDIASSVDNGHQEWAQAILNQIKKGAGE